MLLRCESLDPPMSQMGQIRPWRHVRVESVLPLPPDFGHWLAWLARQKSAKTRHGPLPGGCESDVALCLSCQRDVPKSFFERQRSCRRRVFNTCH
jgi:hypothetical protein